MLTSVQLRAIASQHQVHDAIIAREYIQLVFLKALYKKRASQSIYFKGGTAIHLLFGAARFSEDLDFTVDMAPSAFDSHIRNVFNRLEREEGITWKAKKSITGKQYLLSALPSGSSRTLFVRLDFSFREEVLKPAKSILQTEYPVIFTSYVYHLSPEELLAEKIRAIMTRRKGRDLYDAWYLLSRGTVINSAIVQNKLAYYDMGEITPLQIWERIVSFPEKDFVTDLRPFLPKGDRENLPDFFLYLKDSLKGAFYLE